METKRAFTLLELLTVIAIIVLLIGFLMPAMNKARKMSVKIVCMSYMHQYGLVGQLYMEDNDGVFPERSRGWLYSPASVSEAHPIGCRWHDRSMSPGGKIMRTTEGYRGNMWEYIGQMGISTCPTLRRFAKSRGCENPGHRRVLDIEPQYAYTMNGYLGNSQEGGVLRESEVRDPSKVFFFGEENCWSLRPDHPKFAAEWLSAALSTKALDDTVLMISVTDEARDCFATYHNAPSKDLNRGSSNVAFVDGHVERIDVEDQLRRNLHGGRSRFGAGGNLSLAWASKEPPPGGWEGQ